MVILILPTLMGKHRNVILKLSQIRSGNYLNFVCGGGKLGDTCFQHKAAKLPRAMILNIGNLTKAI